MADRAAPADAGEEEVETEESDDDEEGDDDEGSENPPDEPMSLDEASTPQVIMRALEAGGDIAKAVVDTWVQDKSGLSFYYDSSSSRMYCWNPTQEYMYEWVAAGDMRYLWSGWRTPGEQTEVQAQQETTETKVAWITVVPPSVLDAKDAGEDSKGKGKGKGKAKGKGKGKAKASDKAVDGELDKMMAAFGLKFTLKAQTLRKLKKFDGQLQRYVAQHFNPKNVTNYSNAVQKYMKALCHHPQRWRLEALQKDGHLESECETVILDSEGGTIGSSMEEESERKHIVLESQIVDPVHAEIQCLAGHFYALDRGRGSRIDGVKYGMPDGPVPLRDGSTVLIGDYMLFVEVGNPEWLHQRRSRLMNGESPWGKAASAEAATSAANPQEEEVEEEEDEDEEDEEDDEATANGADTNEEKAVDNSAVSAIAAAAASTKRAAEDDGEEAKRAHVEPTS